MSRFGILMWEASITIRTSFKWEKTNSRFNLWWYQQGIQGIHNVGMPGLNARFVRAFWNYEAIRNWFDHECKIGSCQVHNFKVYSVAGREFI